MEAGPVVKNYFLLYPVYVLASVRDPDPEDPCVFGPPGSGSATGSQRYGSGFFYHQAKTERKTLIPIVL
jgi:hypothetical protein